MVSLVQGSPDFPQIIADLYAGTLDDAAWDRALLGIADRVRASAALLFSFNPATRAILRDENHRLDPSILDAYRRHWTYQDCRQEYFRSISSGCPVTEQMLLPWSDLRRTPILNEFLLPSDVPHFMPAWLSKSRSKVVALSLQGTRRRGPFGAADLEVFRNLLPHIRRALEIRDRLERAHVRMRTFAAVLNTHTCGVAILDSSGKLLEENAVVQELRQRRCGVGCKVDGTFWLRSPAGRQLSRWMASGPPDDTGDAVLHVPQSCGPPLSVTIAPIPVHNTSWMVGDPKWLLLIFEPNRAACPNVELLACDLGISPREAEFAALLFTGSSVKEAARRLAVTEHTARAHLKSIFRKTDVRSQSELTRRIALGPAILSALTISSVPPTKPPG